MSSRASIAAAAATGLRNFASARAGKPVMIGFDGFVDSIIAVVDKRLNGSRYEPVRTIEQFGRKIVSAAGMSSNYELVVKLQKLGGNGPIMANALAAAGLPVTYIGAVGGGAVHPAFAELARQATVHAVMQPGTTDALEFDDGKLLLGKYDFLNAFDWPHLEKSLGRVRLEQIFGQSSLIGTINWTMMAGLPDIWRNILAILSQTGSGGSAKPGARKIVFVDLCDPEKRTVQDIRAAMEMLTAMQQQADVILGLNLRESTQVAQVLGVKVGSDPETCIEATSAALRLKLALHTVIIHPRKSAAAARLCNGKVQTATFTGPFVAQPKLSTGAGDNFNAGFCLASLAGLDLPQCLCVGTATSGYYVRNASSPSLEQLTDFCDHLPEPERG